MQESLKTNRRCLELSFAATSCVSCAVCTRWRQVRLPPTLGPPWLRLSLKCELLVVGDAYMAAGGLFNKGTMSDGSEHAPASLLFSLLAHEAAAELGLKLRVGIHCGPVTSGLSACRLGMSGSHLLTCALHSWHGSSEFAGFFCLSSLYVCHSFSRHPLGPLLFVWF